MKIKLPATSANLGIGFDTLGLAVNLYNEFEIVESKIDELIQFDFDGDNLVLETYKTFEQEHNLPHKPVTITQLLNQVPVSRGLGSSATCILAGVFAANELHNLKLTYEECVSYAARLEGHPDNVYACAYGGLISVYSDNDIYYHQSHHISSFLHFYVLIPNIKASTKELRKALPKKLKYSDIVHNLSRIISLPSAFHTGDIKELKRILDDKLHEPYRFPYLVHPDIIQELKQKDDLIVLISGSGNTVLVISDQHFDTYFDYLKDDYHVQEVHIHKGIIELKK